MPGRHAAGLAALALLLTACGGSGSPAGSPPPPGLTGSTTPTPPTSTSATPSQPAWLTYHADGARTGADTTSPPLTSPTLAWTSPRLDGAIYAEPLVDGTVVVVATEGGTLYGLDATSGTVSWQRHLADPVPRAALPCGDIAPLGITGTPVIDGATHTVYAVAETGGGEHLLAAVDDRSGTLLWQRPIDPAGTAPITQQQRAALALTSGRVVVAMGGLFGDCGGYRGYVVSVDAGGGGPLRSWLVPAARGAGIWAPSGSAVDASGDVYVVTGNAVPTDSFDHSDSVVKLSPDLQELDWFAPSNWRQLSAGDLDLGSTGACLLGGGEALVAGKDGIAYLLDTAHLGGIGGAPASLELGGGVYGGMAVSGGVAYLPALNGLDAVRVAGSQLSRLWRGPATWPPILSGGALWAVLQDQPTLVAIDPATGSAVFRYPLGAAEHFTTPTASQGRLYVAAGDHLVALTGI